jgi:hypothetical protein
MTGRSPFDPALLLQCLTGPLEIDGSDALVDEARQTADRILATLSQQSLRSAFLTGLAHHSNSIRVSPGPNRVST